MFPLFSRTGGPARALALATVSALLLASCESDDPTPAPTPVTTPTPTPAPTPAPAGPTFTVSGTISETAPTTSTRVPEAEVQLSGGVATGSGGDGTFTIPNVTNGTYTLRVAKAGYETATQTVTVPGANVTGVQVNLLPVFRWVEQEHYHQLGPGSPAACPGLTDGRPCRSYPVASHHSGGVRAFHARNTTAADFALEFWCGNTRVERRDILGGDHDEILPNINAGQSCAIYVVQTSGSVAVQYTLYLRFPY
jgi:hypothetical protein